jgi:hypothetical protein
VKTTNSKALDGSGPSPSSVLNFFPPSGPGDSTAVDQRHVATGLKWLEIAGQFFRVPIGDNGRLAMENALGGAIILLLTDPRIKIEFVEPLIEVLRALRMPDEGETHAAFKGSKVWDPKAAKQSDIQEDFWLRCLVASEALVSEGVSRKNADEKVLECARPTAALLGVRMGSKTSLKDKRKRFAAGGFKIEVPDDGVPASFRLNDVSLFAYKHLAKPEDFEQLDPVYAEIAKQLQCWIQSGGIPPI